MNRARLRFLVRVLVFLVPLAWVTRWFDCRLREVPSMYQHKRVALDRERARIELMIVGSSEATYGINPKLLSLPAFNFSFLGQGLTEMDQLSSFYLERIPHLSGLILSLAYCVPEERLSEDPERWKEYYYNQEFGVHGDQSLYAWLDLRTFFPVFLTRPRYGIHTLLGWDKPFRQEDRDGYLGFEPSSPGLTQRDFDQSSVMADYHNKIMSPDYFPSNLRHLVSILERAQDKGLKVFLVRTPAAPGYRKAVVADAGKRYMAALPTILARFPNVKALDYYADQRFVFSDFSDTFHLDTHGAEKLTRLLEEDIVRPYFGSAQKIERGLSSN